MPDVHSPAGRKGRRRTARAAVPVAILALACLALAASPLPARAQLSERLDTNGDGFMDQKEAQDSALAKFQALDRSRDGALSDAEIGLAQGAPNPLDKNADGLVSFDEYWLYFGNVFTSADGNRDGRLSPEELQSMRQ